MPDEIIYNWIKGSYKKRCERDELDKMIRNKKTKAKMWFMEKVPD